MAYPVSVLAFVNVQSEGEKDNDCAQAESKKDKTGTNIPTETHQSHTETLEIVNSEVSTFHLLEKVDLGKVPSYKVALLSYDWNSENFGTAHHQNSKKIEIQQGREDLKTLVKNWSIHSKTRIAKKLEKRLIEEAILFKKLAEDLKKNQVDELRYYHDFERVIGLLHFARQNELKEFNYGIKTLKEALLLLVANDYYDERCPTNCLRSRIGEIFYTLCYADMQSCAWDISIVERVLDILKKSNSLYALSPTKTCIYFMSSLVLLVHYFETRLLKNGLGKMRKTLMEFLSDCIRRSNNSNMLFSALLGLNSLLISHYNLEQKFAKESVAHVSDMVACPDLLLSDPTGRFDFGTILCAATLLGNVAKTRQGAILLCKSGAIRRIIALLKWGLLYHDELKWKQTEVFTTLKFITYNIKDLDEAVKRIIFLSIWILLRCCLVTETKNEQTPALWKDLYENLTRAVSWARDKYSQAVEREEQGDFQDDAEDDLMAQLEKEALAKQQDDLSGNCEVEDRLEGEHVQKTQQKYWLWNSIEISGLYAVHAILRLSAVSMAEPNILKETVNNILNLEQCLSSDARIVGSLSIISALQQSQVDIETQQRYEEVSQNVKIIHLLNMYHKANTMSEEQQNLSRVIMFLLFYYPALATTEVTESILSTIECTDFENYVDMTYLSGAIWCIARRGKSTRIKLGDMNACEILMLAISRTAEFVRKTNSGNIYVASKTLTYMVQAVWELAYEQENAMTLVNEHRIDFLIQIANEFSSRLNSLSIICLKLIRTVCTHSTCAEKLATPGIMSLLFEISRKSKLPVMQENEQEYQLQRLASSLLFALPFVQEIGEPCYVALARNFIFASSGLNRDSDCVLKNAINQQIFGARLFSRIKFSNGGYELLRRNGSISKLVEFVLFEFQNGFRNCTDSTELGCLYHQRRQNALIALAYCSLNQKNQRYLSSNSLYQLLVFAWKTERKEEQDLVTAILNNLNSNKNNRTRLYMAEMRARNIVTKYVNDIGTGETVMGDPRPKLSPDESQSVSSTLEDGAALEFENAIGKAFKKGKWQKPNDNKKLSCEQKRPHSRAAKQLPRLQEKDYEGVKLLFKFREKIRNPQNNMSATTRSNSSLIEPYFKPVNLTHHMRQPAKLLWEKKTYSEVHRRDYTSASPWSQPLKLDPLYLLCRQVPDCNSISYLHPPLPPNEIENELNIMNYKLENFSAEEMLKDACGKLQWSRCFHQIVPETAVVQMVPKEHNLLQIEDDPIPIWFELRDMSELPL